MSIQALQQVERALAKRQRIFIHRRKLDIRHETVGPRHDPYARDTVTMVVNGITISIVSCSLETKDWLVIQGHKIDDEQAEQTWELLTGLSLGRAMKILSMRDEEPGYGPLSWYI